MSGIIIRGNLEPIVEFNNQDPHAFENQHPLPFLTITDPLRAHYSGCGSRNVVGDPDP